ncbi:TPA: hypothetical protein ACH3X3_007953 [Trebouxia sp. C0006]
MDSWAIHPGHAGSRGTAIKIAHDVGTVDRLEHFHRRGELKYRDQGVNRTCKRGEAIRVSAPVSPSRASPAPPGPPPRGPAPGRQGVRTSLPGHPSPGSTAGGGPAPVQSAAAASTSAAIAAANAATAAAANAMAGNGDTEMQAPSSGPGVGPSALAPSQ